MMKYKITKITLLTFLFVSFISIIQLEAKQDKVFPVYMELITWKYDNDDRSLIAKLLTEDIDGNELPASGLSVFYYVLRGNEQVQLGEVNSNEKGNAVLKFPAGYDFPKDEEDYITVYAIFPGNDSFEASESELSFKDVNIDFKFLEKDEEKLIFFAGVVYGQNDTLPLADDDLYFYVPCMFSDLMIAEGWFEENGEGFVGFPSNIIGDSTGVVEVIARISEHSDYGYIEKRGFINWAAPFRSVKREVPVRELWTPIAPLWMIITLIIMLAGVWGHYIYAIYELYKIKQLGKKKQKP